MLRSTLGAVLRIAMLPAVILLPAGTWRWWEAWALCSAYVLYAVGVWAWLTHDDPELLRERLKASPAQQGQPLWDRVLMIGMLVAGTAMFVVPGLDVVRHRWSEPLPLAVRIVALLAHAPGFLFIGWVMHTNTFLARVVKIDEARGHQVITTGPYAIVRHPMYLAVLVLLLAFPLSLES